MERLGFEPGLAVVRTIGSSKVTNTSRSELDVSEVPRLWGDTGTGLTFQTCTDPCVLKATIMSLLSSACLQATPLLWHSMVPPSQ